MTENPSPDPEVRDVVVPLDGSAAASSALRVGFGIAERTGGRVVLVRAMTESEDRDTIASELDETIDRFRAVAPAHAEVVQGSPAEAILAAAGGSATVCMGASGRSGVRRMVLGSVAEAVVRAAPRPVVLVGPGVGSLPLARERASLVVCVKGPGPAQWVRAAAGPFARSLDLDCWVVEVIAPDEDPTPAGEPPHRPGLDAALDRCAAHCDALAADGLVARPQVLFGDPARAIEAFAGNVSAGFVSVATSARTGLERHTLGSVTVQITRRSPCPVHVAVERRLREATR